MTKQYVFLVHGMGLMEAGWHEPFVKAIVDAMRNYPPYDEMDAGEITDTLMHFIPVSYDSVFDGYRERWAQLTGDDIADEISEESRVWGGTTAGCDQADRFIKGLRRCSLLRADQVPASTAPGGSNSQT